MWESLRALLVAPPAPGRSLRSRQAHWLRANAAARMPRRVVCFDSEAHTTFTGAEQRQEFRLAVATFDELDGDAVELDEPQRLQTVERAELWEWIVDKTDRSLRTVVYAHNLSYDLRLTGGLVELPRLGFEVRQIALSAYALWAYLSDGRRSLYLVDSLSYLPATLDRIAGLLGRRRVPLPDEGAEHDAWLARCQSDVDVLREAVLRKLRLLREHDLGDWRTTGAGQGSAAFRHRFLAPRTLLVHADLDALAAERRACWAGRAEIWRHGQVDGPLWEYDYNAAYARIGLDVELPARLVGRFRPATLATWHRCRGRYLTVADVDIVTSAPVVPCEHEGRVVWPAGAFSTTLWDNELQLAIDRGADVTVTALWAYDRAPLLRAWAEWILRGLAGEHMGADPLGRLILKDWSRSLIGRFGLRYPLLERLGEVPTNDLALRSVSDLVEHRDTTYLQVGNVEYEQTARVESPNSTPAVMGYIMAEARVRLWRAMEAAGLDNVLSIDTDGLIVGAEGAARLDEWLGALELPGLRRKSEYRRAEFRSPRNLDLDDERRVAGVPRRAEQLAPGHFRGEVWESLPAALRRRRTSTLVVHEREFHVAAVDPRRVHLAGGATAPLVLGALT